jgi:hypothetical protein
VPIFSGGFSKDKNTGDLNEKIETFFRALRAFDLREKTRTTVFHSSQRKVKSDYGVSSLKS